VTSALDPADDGPGGPRAARAWFCDPAARRRRCPAETGDARAFHAGLPGYRPTPLVEPAGLAEELAVRRVFVKDESDRLGLPAFKALGASWAVASAVAGAVGLAGPLTLPALRAASAGHSFVLVTATDGNHGRAVARFAALLGHRAHVVVPAVVGAGAVAAIVAEGAQVTRVGGSYDDAVERAATVAAGTPGGLLVQDTAWPGYEQVPSWIVAGYATMLTEIDEQLREAGEPRPDLVAVPIGVGSLAQAVVTHYRSGPPPAAPSVLGVEPDTAACVLAGLRAGHPVSVPTAATVMAGLNCGTVSCLAWPVLHRGLDAAIAVRDHEAEQAVVELARLGVSCGPSGAASLAGVRAALTGAGSDRRREALGIGAGSVLVLLSTEGSEATR
jgi:diaminopropionate ammonia-lyase